MFIDSFVVIIGDELRTIPDYQSYYWATAIAIIAKLVKLDQLSS